MQIIGINQRIALAEAQQSLREGDFVFVRVLKNLGGGNYSVSFAGGRFNVLSERALSAGETFRAQVSFLEGKVLLTPEKSLQAFEGAALLSGFGLAADGVGERILQFLTQSGAKLDAALMQKARRLAQKFKGREAAAAEAVLALEEKGIDSDSLALDALMDFVDGGAGGREAFDFADDGKSGEGKSDAAPPEIDCGQIAAELKRYFKFILESAALRGEGSGSEIKDEGSFLAFFNQKAGASNSAKRKGWLFFPFEIENAREDSILGRGGVIRLYSDFEKKVTEKMIVNFKGYGGNIFFALYFEKDKSVSAIHLCAGGKSLEEKLKASLGLLKAAFGGSVKAEIIPYENFSPFGVKDAPVYGVEAFA